jgi:hypothetical protein
MLTQILQEFKNTDGGLDLNQLSRKLDIEPAALEGMLDHLVQLGKLKKEMNGASCDMPCSQCSCTDCCSTAAMHSGFRWKLKA